MKKVFNFIVFFLLSYCLSAEKLQDSTKVNSAIDSTQIQRNYKNTIRYNFSNSAFFESGSHIFGYERVVKPYQSFSVNFGMINLPKLVGINIDSAEITKDSKSNGFSIAGDYRFYLKKENKHLAPRGVYIGPYAYYSLMKRTNNANVLLPFGNELDFEIKNRLDVIVVGFQLGYQFLFYKNRIALDMILFGPGVGFYRYQGSVSSEVTGEQANELLIKIRERLLEKYPAANILSNEQSFSKKGSAFTSDFGYRLVFQVGYRF